MDNVGLNSGNCILVTSGNISVRKSPCGSISFTCAQMLHIQVRFAQQQFASFGHLFFSDRFFDSAPSPIVTASSFVSIPSSLTPSSSLLSFFWLLFLLSLWLSWAESLLQLLEAWSMPLGLLWWAVSPFKQSGLKRRKNRLCTWNLGTLCAPHPPICQKRQHHQGRSSHQTQSFGLSHDLLRRRHHLPKSKHQVHGIGLSQTKEDT